MSLARYTPLRRVKPMRRTWMRKRAPKRLARRAADAPRLNYIRAMSCIACGRHGPCEASHVTTGPNVKGTGMKVSDRSVVPHCGGPRGCHAQWEQRRGRFAGWTREERWEQARAWVVAVELATTPEDHEHALVLEAAGLGRIETTEHGWAWRTP